MYRALTKCTIAAIALALLFPMLAHIATGDPYSGAGNACGPPANKACLVLPQPTAGGVADGTVCTVGSPGITQYGLTRTVNGVSGICIPSHQYTVAQVQAGNCTGCSAAQVNQYLDWAESGYGFTAATSAFTDCETNYPYDFSTPPPTGGKATGCRIMKYWNPWVVHANEVDNNVQNGGAHIIQGGVDFGTGSLGFGVQGCTSPGTTVKTYGTPGNPNNITPPGVLGVLNILGGTFVESELIHNAGTSVTATNRSYFATEPVSGCSNANGTPASDYNGNPASTLYREWWASYASGNSVGHFNNANDVGTPSNFFHVDTWETDQSASQVTNESGCSNVNGVQTSPPLCTATTVLSTLEWSGSGDAPNEAMLNARCGFWAYVATQTAPAHFMFNGLEDGLTNSNVPYKGVEQFNSSAALVDKSTANTCSGSNVRMGEYEEFVIGFGNHVPDTRIWPHELNGCSLDMPNMSGLVYFLHHESDPTVATGSGIGDQNYLNAFVLSQLCWKFQRIAEQFREEDGSATFANDMAMLPIEQLVSDPGDGFPAMLPYTRTYDGNVGPSGSNNKDWGGGCAKSDVTATDHGAADLLPAGAVGGLTPAGACLQDGSSSNRTDFKANRVGVYRREFNEMYYISVPISSASAFAAAAPSGDAMGVMLNPSNQTYNVRCTDFPHHTYAHRMHIAAASLAPGASDVLDASSTPYTFTTFVCGTNSDGSNGTNNQIAAESSIVVVQ